MASKGSGTVTPIAVATNKAGPPVTVAATPDPDSPLLLAMTRDGSTVYSNEPFDAISTATNTVTASVPGVVAADIAVTPDANAAYVTGLLDITPINLVTDQASDPVRFGVPGSGSVNGLSVSPDGTTVWTTVSDNNANSVVALSTASNSETGSAPLPSHGFNVAVSPDGTTAYVVLGGSVIPVSTTTFTAVPAIPAGSGASAVVFAPAPPVPTGSSPVFTSSTTHTAAFGQALSFTVTAAGQPAPTISRAGALPPGVKFTHSSGQAVQSGTPGREGRRDLPRDLHRREQAGHRHSGVHADHHRAPSGWPAAVYPRDRGHGADRHHHRHRLPVPALQKTGQLPAGLTFTDNGDGTATIGGIPAVRSPGRYPITVTATSAEGTASRDYTILISR